MRSSNLLLRNTCIVMNFYDDNKILIATSIDQLMVYFQSLAGVISVTNIPYKLACPMCAVLQVQSSGVLPKFIYKGDTSPSSKIYPSLLPANTTNLDSLCNNSNYFNGIPIPVVGSPVQVEITVPTPVVGTPQSTDANTYTLSIQGTNGWTNNNTYSSAVNNKGEVSLNLSVSNPQYNFQQGQHLFSNELIGIISAKGIPVKAQTITSDTNPNLPTDTMVEIDNSGNIYYSGYPNTEDQSGATIEIIGINYNING